MRFPLAHHPRARVSSRPRSRRPHFPVVLSSASLFFRVALRSFGAVCRRSYLHIPALLSYLLFFLRDLVSLVQLAFEDVQRGLYSLPLPYCICLFADIRATLHDVVV